MKISNNIKDLLTFLIPVTAIGVMMVLVGDINSNTPKLTKGEVVDKTYNPAHTDYRTDYNYGRLSSSHSPETWKIRVAGLNSVGAIDSQWWEVGAGLYSYIGIGDSVTRDPVTKVIRVNKVD